MKRAQLFSLLKKHHSDKRSGVKHTPLHTLKECLDEAGITPQKYSRYVRKYPGAPEPRFVNRAPSSNNRSMEHHVKKDVLAYIEQCRKAEGETA